MAASVLHALGRRDEIARRFAAPGARIVTEMLDKNVQAPLTSSAGRCFDAAAGLLGIAARSRYEGEAAMRLEALALQHGPVMAPGDGYTVGQDGVLNLLPLLERMADEQDAGRGAAVYHAGLTAAVSEWVQQAAARQALRHVVLSGGCFINGILSQGVTTALRAAGLNVYMARRLPANDGGLSLGQAWVAMQTLL